MGRLHKGMIRFALVRFVGLIAMLAVVSTIIGALLGGAPGALAGALAGDFGQSADGVPVGALIAERLTVTLPLALMALALSLLAGIPLGAFAAGRGRLAARTVAVLADGALALPAVFAGMVLVLFFTGLLKWLPQGGFVPWEQNFGAAFNSLLLPALALAIPLGALNLRTALRSFAGAADLPEVVAGRLAGLTRRQAAWRHGYPAATLPVAAQAGGGFGLAVAAAMVVENVFYLPGLGRLLFSAVAEQDFAVLRGGLFVLVAISAVARYATDVALVAADPQRLTERTA